MTVANSLRQMLAVLETERQALATVDLDSLTAAAGRKDSLAAELADAGDTPLDPESRALAEAAWRLNETNRITRNLLSANVAARLAVLTGRAPLYGPGNRRANVIQATR